MPSRERPTSPHLGIYRWQLGNSLSILHRLTGIALAVGLAALCCWFMSIAGGDESYEAAMRLFASPPGLALLLGWTFAFLYHLLNGMRHLLWDAGYGFERSQRRMSGWIAIVGALGLTVGVWVVVWHGVRP